MEEEIIKTLKKIDWQLKALGLDLDTLAQEAVENSIRLLVNRAYHAGHSEALKEVLQLFTPKIK